MIWPVSALGNIKYQKLKGLEEWNSVESPNRHYDNQYQPIIMKISQLSISAKNVITYRDFCQIKTTIGSYWSSYSLSPLKWQPLAIAVCEIVDRVLSASLATMDASLRLQVQ
jgi:hypothetical protein